MNQNNKQLKVQSLAFASQLLPAIIGVLSFMLLVRLVQPEVLGEYLMYVAAVVLFEMIKSGGLQSALVMRLSGKSEKEQSIIIGSAYWLGGGISLLISIVLILLYFSNIFSQQHGINVFCGWYALLGLITLPLHIAEAKAVAKQDLNFLLVLRIAQSANALIISVYAWQSGGRLQEYASLHLAFTALLMLLIVAAAKADLKSIRNKAIHEVKELFHLMKFTLATLATTNLLKSADTFLIGGMMGPKAVAAYAVPLKLTELFEIPLRSLSTTAFPQLAAAHNEKNAFGFKQSFIQYTSWVYMLYIPALIVAFIAAPMVVTTLGGAQYAYTAPVFRVFCLYGLLLPTDRLTGISLDALQKPNRNFIKVACMALVNIMADVIAIKLTGKLEWVAFASVINAATGALLGFYMLQKETGFAFNNTVAACMQYSKNFLKKGTEHFLAKPV